MAGSKESDKEQNNNLVHGIKLNDMLKYLVKEIGWEGMGQRVDIKCFTNNPSMGSSITFLRRTAWAKNAVQALFIDIKTNGKNSTTIIPKEKPVPKKRVGNMNNNPQPKQKRKEEGIDFLDYIKSIN